MKFRVPVISFFIFLALICKISAQLHVMPNIPRDVSVMTAVDSCKVRVWYALNAEDIKDYHSYEDWHRLEIGSQMSKYYSYFVYRNDSLCTEQSKNNPVYLRVPRRCDNLGNPGKHLWSEYYHTDFFKNFSEGTLTQYTFMPRGVPHHKYTENMPVQNWTLLEDTASIAGYLCQKATCMFRGRNFEAWFTPEIPIGNGPWKFGGLPGLILKVYDADSLYVFECTHIDFSQYAFTIQKHDSRNYLDISREKYRKIVKNINEDYDNFIGGRGGPRIYPPYNPLELE